MMLELREKELYSKMKMIDLQKLEVLREQQSKEKGQTGQVRDKNGRRFKSKASKVMIDRVIYSDAYSPLQHQK